MGRKSCLVLLLLVVAFVQVGCEESVAEKRAERRENVVTVPEVVYFTEAKKISQRQIMMDDPNLVMWIYCLSDSGAVVYYGPVVGKVVSSGKRLEPITLDDEDPFRYAPPGSTEIELTSERMQADGTFGTSDAYVFWFDPNGIYHQWSSNYFLTSVPIKIETPVINFRDVDQEMAARQEKAIEILRAGGCVNENLFEVDCQTREPIGQ